MSRLSKALESPAAAIFNPTAYVHAMGLESTAAGETGHGTGAQPNISPGAIDRVNQIIKVINSQQGRGTYGEGDVQAFAKEYAKLKSDLDAGKISQSDYVAIGDQLIPQMAQYTHQLDSGGQKSSEAVRSVGAQSVYDAEKEFNIYKAGQQYLGRDLTPAEVAQIKPKYADGADIGNAYVAELGKQEASSPEALGRKAGQYTGDVNSMFQNLLKRGATKDEIDYFGRALASGQTTPYQLSQYVQSLPEYQGQQDTQFRQGLQNELSNYDTQAFQREKDNILSSYAKSGLGNSSSLDFAITDALSKMQTNRDQFLGGLSAQQYGGNKQAALGAYQQSQNQYLQNQDYQRNLGQSNLNYLTGRADQGSDYNRQMSDYLNYLNSQPKQKGPGFLDTAVGVTQATAPWAYLAAM